MSLKWIIPTVFAATVAALPARAEIVKPDHGLTETLDDMGVSIYYSETVDGYHVVMTASSTDEPYRIIRYESTLLSGQDATVSVPRGVGQPAVSIRLHRVGDRVDVERAP